MPKTSADKIIKADNVTVPEELSEDNYEDWKACLKNYLVGHGLWGVVSGKEVPPSKDRKEEYEEWKRKNALALHAIRLSCGSSAYSKFKEAHVSASFAWKHLAEKIKRPKKLQQISDHHVEESHVEDNGMKEHLEYEALYEAIENDDLSNVTRIIKQKPEAVRARISSHNDTALHIAILAGHTRIAQELVSKMTPKDLEMVNEYGLTPLSLAAISGVEKLAKTMVGKNHELVKMENDHDDGHLPVIVAALYGQKRMVRFLYRVTPKDELSPARGENGATLLNCLITAEIYDVASLLLKRYPKLGITRDHSGNYPLHILSHKPSAFPSGTKLVFWKQWIYSCVLVHSPWASNKGSHDEDETAESQSSQITEDQIIHIHDSSSDEEESQMIAKQARGFLHDLGWRIIRCLVPDIKHIHDRKLVNDEAVQLLSHIFKEMRGLSKSELDNMDIDKIMYDAIKHGIIEFVVEILKYNPEFIWRKDRKGRTIFAHAILLRQEKIYSLMYKLGTKKSIMARRHDIFGNNFLHLAAKLSPPTQLEHVSGAALQMQRELQWFMEVESVVQPKLKEDLNDNNKTPEMLFSDEHETLRKEGQRWMKNTAGSSMIVGTLIAAVMFTTAFTVPGGNDSKNGLPVMMETQPKTFLISMVANALSMFTSSTSILMFLGILTARYAEEDFLKSLPTKLIFGLACLFLSIVTMMASFGTSLYLILNQQLSWVSYPLIVFSIIPIALYTMLQFPLLVEMLFRTYGSSIFDKPRKKRLFWCFK